MSKYLPLCAKEEDMRDAAVKICKDFLHGAWKTVSPEDLVFKRISGGLSNFLYYVALPEKVSTSVPVTPPLIEQNKEDKSAIRKLLGRSLSRQMSFLTSEPKKVLIRIYGQTQSERGADNIIMDSVIFTLLSERRLGPRLHGVFSGGRIEEYIPARPLLTRELSEPAFSMKIAEKMAAIHSMDVPLCKEPQWLWRKIAKWHQAAMINLETNNNDDPRLSEVIEKIRKFNYTKEILWLKSYLDSVNSPVVFCHNDLQEGNILLREDVIPQTDETNDDINIDYSSIQHDSSSDSFLSASMKGESEDEHKLLKTDLGADSISESAMDISQNDQVKNSHYKNTQPNKKRKSSFNPEEDCNSSDSVCSHISDGSVANGEPNLVLIDYEYCAYNHRGFDLANHFIEWAYEYTNPDHPFYYERFDQYATLEQKEIFMKQYLLKMNGGESPSLEELNQLNTEVEAFSLASHLFWSLWAIVNASKSQIPFGYWDYGLSRIEWYYRCKQDIVKNDNGSSLKRKIREVDI